ncbi:NAD(P)/FAD-dependent oxidoreductase [Nonomuraea sp. NPDC050536]|uniref:NAD(P)/FAD-dependent oxidoreductase n=1 Tax=Nonomuraea sp. NPDC050536 TaxID=3364366 RepID=UPI0037C94A51
MNDTYDVVIIGGGAAGLSTALVLGRARRRVAVIDSGEPRNAPAEHMHSFLSRDGMPPSALLELGLRERWGVDVLQCPYCHGYEVRDEPLGVLGNVPHALLLRQWSDDVVFFPGEVEPTADELERLEARGVPVVAGKITRMVVDGGRLRGVELAGGRVVPRTAVFVMPRMVPNDAVLTELGCEQANGWVVTDPSGRTNVDGVWAVGNVVDPRAQVITAAGMGAAAAFILNHDLVEEEVVQALTIRSRIS